MSLGPSPIHEATIVVASTFTSEPIEVPLRAWWRWLGSPSRLRFAPFHQVFQQLLDPQSLLASNRSGTNILLVRLEDWDSSGELQAASSHALDFYQAVEQFAATSAGRLIVCFCPASAARRQDLRQQETRVERELITKLADIRHVDTIASTETSDLYPVLAADDPVAARAGCIPYTQAYFTALATLLVRRLHAFESPLAKVIVLDCDDTLWDGVCGEVGPLGVQVSPRRQELQRALLHYRESGLLLCLCSKNNPNDAWAVFDEHPHMLLKREHLSAAHINWQPKSENLRRLAEQLNLGLDSFVFLDDSPLECAEVRANLPEVLTLQLPQQQSLSHFLKHVWALDRLSVTDEDRLRAERYSQEQRREQRRREAPSLEQFLADLKLKIDFLSVTQDRLPRAAQLTQRTNQFNFTARRQTASEIQQMCGAGGTHHGFLVDASDRFGDYGIVGLVLYELAANLLRVDSLMLSCRALGRRIELQMLQELAKLAQQADVAQIEISLAQTEKNQPAREFADRLLKTYRTSSASDSPILYALSPPQLLAAVDQFRGGTMADEKLKDEPAPVANRLDPKLRSRPWAAQASELFNHIASHLGEVESILKELRGEARQRPALEEPYSPPRTPSERQAAEICAEVLNIDRVGLRDSLKDLGASSLHIVQIFSRLEQQFAAGLSITELFALPTLADIVARLHRDAAAVGESRPETWSATNSRPIVQSASGIAVIGMAGRFPGAQNVREFWGNVTRGVCSIVEIPDAQLNLPANSPLRTNPNLVRKAASVQDADKFDAKFFGIFPKEATVMDPQHRLLLENCWHAIEDAGYNVDTLRQPVGVFAGCYMDTYMLASLALSPKWLESLADAFHGGDLLTELGNDKDYLATRVAFLLNLRGPAITVQTACSTSLVAIAQACQSLVSGQCDMALAGGATLKLPQNRGYLYTEGGMVSPDGVCRTFDAKARGTVFGEGCAAVLLKRVEDAVADGDDIYAVIKGWGLNNDGRAKLGYTAPSVIGQAGAIEMAHRLAGVSAESITLVEAHGTGTSLGDPIEIESLTRVFRKTSDRKQYCAIGSVKTNIGHLDVAAGVTGLIKTSLALKNRLLPPSLNFEKPNPNIDFESSPFYVNTELRDWHAPAPRRAGLSSFGVGGTNAHVVLEEAPEPNSSTSVDEPQLLILSGRSPGVLEQQRCALLEHLRSEPQLDVADVAFTLQTGRRTFNYTLATVVHNTAHAISVLQANSSQQVFTQRQIRRGKAIAFMFPGQGAQHLNMAADLYQCEANFRKHFEQCAELLRPHLGFDLGEKIFVAGASSAAEMELTQTSLAQTGIFSVSYALAKWFESRGIVPQRMLGHSVGEFVAACLADVFSLEDALRLIAFRATQMQQLPKGSMLAVRLTEAELKARLPPDVSLAAINGPQLCVVSGPTTTIDRLQQGWEAEGVVCRKLHTSHAFHSAMMDSVVEPFAEQLRLVNLRPPTIPIVSSVSGQPLTDSQAVDANYWARHMRETVRFTDTLATLFQDDELVPLEVGPGQTLSTLARQHPARQSEQTVLSALPHAKQSISDREHALLAIGRLWQSGVEVDWSLPFQAQRRRRLHLPGYPFERQRYWLEAEPVDSVSDAESSDSLFDAQVAVQANASQVSAAATPAEVTDVAATEGTPHPLAADFAPVAHGGQAAADDIDALRRRIIQQQLQLMKQQLEAWQR